MIDSNGRIDMKRIAEERESCQLLSFKKPTTGDGQLIDGK